MAFTATINSIQAQGATNIVTVGFADSATGWSVTESYTFPFGTTQTAAVAQITADGTSYKASLAANAALQARVGFVITI